MYTVFTLLQTPKYTPPEQVSEHTVSSHSADHTCPNMARDSTGAKWAPNPATTTPTIHPKALKAGQVPVRFGEGRKERSPRPKDKPSKHATPRDPRW